MPGNLLPLRLLSFFPQLIPGIEQVVLVHSPSGNGEFTGWVLRKQDQEYETVSIRVEKVTGLFEELMKGAFSYQWYPKNQIPFEIISQEKVQLTIFSELKNSVLLILLKPTHSTASNLFFVYFNENLSNFLLDKVSEPFSAQHKNMVGYLLYHSAKTIYQLLEAQNQLSSTFTEQMQLIVKERDTLRVEREETRTKEQTGLIKLAQHYLKQAAGKMGIHAVLTDSAKVKIREFNGEIYELEEIIQRALEFAGALTIPQRPGSPEILLADYHIRFPLPTIKDRSPEGAEGLPPRYIKTHLLLDRLEQAASGLKQRKSSLTSAKVGKAFPSPISAPAITDALRKHKKRILDLFEKYPEKWEVIRHEFRPIQNILGAAPAS